MSDIAEEQTKTLLELAKIFGQDHYTGAIPGHLWLFESWRLPQYIEEAERIEDANEFFECYKCKKSFWDLGVTRMLKGNEEVTVCLVCAREGLKPRGRTKEAELHRIPDPPQPKRKLKHGYYDEAPKDCDCVFCHRK